MLDHRRRDHLRAGRQLAVQTDQLFFQQGKGLRYANQHPVERALGDLAGGNETHAFGRQVVACQVFLQGQMGQMRIAAAGHFDMRGQRAGQRTEAVIENQHPRGGRQTLFMQRGEQVFVGGVEGLQRLVGLLRLADQVEAGVRGVENRHENWRCLWASERSIKSSRGAT